MSFSFRNARSEAKKFGSVDCVQPVHHLIEGALRLVAPMPSVLERLNLRVRMLSARTLEKHVVGGLAVKWRIEVDEVNALIIYDVPQGGQVVAVIELVQFV